MRSILKISSTIFNGLNEGTDLDEWRNSLIIAIIWISIYALLPAMIISFPAYINEKRYELIGLDIFVWLALLIICSKKRTSYQLKKLIYIFFLYTMTLSFFIALGPHYARSAWLLFCAVIAALFFGSTAAVLATVANLVMLVVLFFGLNSSQPSWVLTYQAGFSSWAVFVVNVTLLTLAASLPVSFLITRLEVALKKERLAHDQLIKESLELKSANEQLRQEKEEREKLENELLEKETRLEMLTDNLMYVMVYQAIWEPSGRKRFTYVSGSVNRLNEVSAETVLADPTVIYNQMIPEHLDGLLAKEKEALQSLRSFRHEVECRLPSGKKRWFELAANPRPGLNGAILWDGVEIDITERKQVEDSLRASEELYTRLMATLPDIVVRTDVVGDVTFINKTGLQISGFDESEIVGRNFLEFLPPDDQIRAVENYAEMFDHQLGPKEYHMIIKNGNQLLFEINGDVLRNADGSPFGTVQVCRDITARKLAEEELRRLRNYLSNIIDSMPSLLIGVDAKGRVTQWNREAANQTGVPPKDAIGRLLNEIPPGSAIDLEPIRQAMLKCATPRGLRQSRLVNGRMHYEDITIYPLSTDDFGGAVIRVDDVTSRVQIEEMVIQSEKMMSIGGLAAGMAHEINNPLAGMIQGAQNIIRRFSSDLSANSEAAKRCGTDLDSIRAFAENRKIFYFLDGIIESGLRAARIVANMLEFSRRPGSEMRPVALEKLLNKTIELAASDYDLKKQYDFRHIEIVRDYDPSLPPVVCEPTKIEQVIFNLVKNAAQALNQGRGMNGPPCLALRTRLEGEMAVMEIEDNGPGMTEEVRKRIFEPFFTTKATGTGTGLGLSISYFIICDTHRGRFTVESSPGQGAKFIIALPLKK